MNKYKNIKTNYNGITYDSKLEVTVAQELDLLLAGKEICFYERQVKFDIVINDFIIGYYKADFVICHNGGTREIIECKGMWRDIGKWKIKLVYALYPEHKITIRQKHQSYTFEGKFIK